MLLCSKRTVQRHLDTLQRAGLIRQERTKDARGFEDKSCWHITISNNTTSDTKQENPAFIRGDKLSLPECQIVTLDAPLGGDNLTPPKEDHSLRTRTSLRETPKIKQQRQVRTDTETDPQIEAAIEKVRGIKPTQIQHLLSLTKEHHTTLATTNQIIDTANTKIHPYAYATKCFENPPPPPPQASYHGTKSVFAIAQEAFAAEASHTKSRKVALKKLDANKTKYTNQLDQAQHAQYEAALETLFNQWGYGS